MSCSKENDLNSEYIFSITVDKNETISFVNDYYIKISGFQKDEIVKKNLENIFHKDVPKIIIYDLLNTVSKENVWEGIVKCKKFDGGFFWVDLNIFRCEDGDFKIRMRQALQREILSAESKFKETKEKES